MGETRLRELLSDWSFWGRPKQLPPDGLWSTWMLRAGRGFGKTRTGAAWTHGRAMEHAGRWMAYIGRNPADVRDYMVEGPGGILRNTAKDERPLYEPSKRRLTWPNGSFATVYSAEDPEQLRGFSGDTAWLDEMGKYPKAKEVWDNLQFGMREASGDRPRRLITTTPRPLPILRKIEALMGTVVVLGTSYENRANLDPTWFDETIAAYEGTRFGRQEIHAEILDDVPGALWSLDAIDNLRCGPDDLPDLVEIVVAIDPAAKSEEHSDESGIVVAGRDQRGRGYVLEDATMRGAPHDVMSRAISAYYRWEATRVVAEVNNGGDWIGAVLHGIDRDIPYRTVTATRGKALRAEPIATKYEAGLVRHVGIFDALETQMTQFTIDYDRKAHGSPDRLDALVWALTHLMIAPRGTARATIL